MQQFLVFLSALLLISASDCVAKKSPPPPKNRKPTPPPASPTPVSPNAGLNPPIYNSWDLINVNTAPTIGPVVGTLGTRYAHQSMTDHCLSTVVFVEFVQLHDTGIHPLVP